jgi:RNA polymerase sigma-70 factor (ECF subfamily)
MNLKQQIQNLDGIHKQVVCLRISGELNFKEIGDLFNKSETWARVTFYRAKNMLMKGVNNNGKK